MSVGARGVGAVLVTGRTPTQRRTRITIGDEGRVMVVSSDRNGGDEVKGLMQFE